MNSQIKDNFNRAARSYDDYASIQKTSSNHLAMTGINLGFNFKTILDIGCGTGNTSVEFLRIYNGAEITLCDISDKMIAQALQKVPRAKYVVCNAEHYDFQSTYDLCISNLSFQWFENLELFLSKIMNKCECLAFSTLSEGSFEEYHELFPTKFLPYISVSKLKKIAQNYGDIIISDYKSYDMFFSNALCAAKYFKYIGANYAKSSNQKNVSILLSHKEKFNLKHNVFFVYLSRKRK